MAWSTQRPGHPSPVPCLAHNTLTTVWGLRPGWGIVGAGVHSEGPLTARYSPQDDVVYPVDGPGKLITVTLASPYLPGRLVSDRAKRGPILSPMVWPAAIPCLP